MLLILDLCGGTGSWSRPYRDAGYRVEIIDIGVDGTDVRTLQRLSVGVHGILAAPDCTDLASCGARYWDAKGREALLVALALVDACIRVAVVQQPRWWALENPIGRLSRYLGPPRLCFDPCDYGDPYTKRTNVWGDFTPPPKRRPVTPTQGSKMHRLPPSPQRKALRSVTPPGFARAFFEANP